MVRGFRNILLILSVHIALVSCLSSASVDDRPVPVTYLPAVSNNVRSGNMHFPENLTFGVWAIDDHNRVYINREEVLFDGTDWCSSNKYYWPVNMLRFVAFAPYGYDFNLSGKGSLCLENFENPDSDKALFAVSMTAPMTRSMAGKVSLDFVPLTCRLDFRIANGLGKNTDMRLEKIILEDVYVAGDYDSSENPQWKAKGDKLDIVVSEDVVDLSHDYVYVGKTLDIVPQASPLRIKVIYSFSTGGSGWITGQEDIAGYAMSNWEPGRRYTYSIVITEDSVHYTTGIGNWSHRN